MIRIYKENCTCGNEIELETDQPVKKIICSKCEKEIKIKEKPPVGG